jgi:hypothetical protein
MNVWSVDDPTLGDPKSNKGPSEISSKADPGPVELAAVEDAVAGSLEDAEAPPSVSIVLVVADESEALVSSRMVESASSSDVLPSDALPGPSPPVSNVHPIAAMTITVTSTHRTIRVA